MIELRDKAKKQLRVQNAMTIAGQRGRDEWVEVDEKELKGTFKRVPERSDVLPDINENLVVELYSK
ncbi:30S ribosomal protein S4 [compost metagenome]